ncbi:MAG: hypothetical protein CTY35_00255 [Methylotenera sp.]|uniref:type 4b pilus protein PilO2 n=1 Tax=Methylotenera sp. TaxID=2051956 RepID=UPI000D477E3F|nr:type 4b pilus protein PilO2 [Methylotenera sp.]PPC84787.1 MAG: hypothetical protein CTY38_00255 [Methylotenera sp.]PPD02146.1 MAG: hypothetical protein CTY35_00255 [Methylotenera sp.]
MTSRIISSSGRNLALALDWNILNGIKRLQDEVSDLSKTVGSVHYAKTKNAGSSDALAGFLMGDHDFKGKLYSAAQAFASMPGISEHSIFIWELNEEETWVCVAKDGYPVIGSDIILDKFRARSFASDQISFSDSDKGITIYGNAQGFDGISPLSLEDIAEACGKDDEIKKVSSFNVSPAALITVLTLLSACAGGGWYYMEQQRIEELKRAQIEAQKVDPNVLYEESLKKAKPGFPASQQWKAIKASVEGIEVYAAGWKFKAIECDFNSVCTLTWDRINGSNSDLMEALKLPADVKWETDGSKMSYMLPVTQPVNTAQIDLQKSPTMKTFFVGFMSEVQNASRVGLRVSIKSPEAYGLPPGIPATQVKPELVAMSGAWEASGDYWMTEFIETMPENFAISTIRVEFQGEKITFDAKGNYYAKN